MTRVKTSHAQIDWSGREFVDLKVVTDDTGLIQSSQLSVIGSNPLLLLAREYRTHLKGLLKDLPLPTGTTAHEMAIREVILRIQEKWNPPYQQDEICHCRAVPTATVDLAICMGAHSVRKIREATSANTACGTCRPDVEALLNHRLNKSS